MSVNDPQYWDRTCVKPAFHSLCQIKKLELTRRTRSYLKLHWLCFLGSQRGAPGAREDPMSQHANWSGRAHLAQIVRYSAGV